jgi:hypothetical protein
MVYRACAVLEKHTACARLQCFDDDDDDEAAVLLLLDSCAWVINLVSWCCAGTLRAPVSRVLGCSDY